MELGAEAAAAAGAAVFSSFSSMSDALHSVCVNVPPSLLSENIFATVKKTPSVPYPTHLLCVLLRWGYGLLQVKL